MADSDTASYLCRTSGRCHNNIPQTVHCTAHRSVVSKKKKKKKELSSPKDASCDKSVVAVVMFRSYLLYCVTLGALHFSDFKPVHLVVFLCVMAQSADIQFATTRCLQNMDKHIL